MKSLTRSVELQKYLEDQCLIHEFQSRKWDTKSIMLMQTFVREKGRNGGASGVLEECFQMIGDAQDISPGLQSLLQNLVKELKGIKNSDELNQYIECIWKYMISNEFKSSFSKQHFIAELTNLGLAPGAPGLVDADDYDRILEVTALRGSVAELKTQDISAESRSFLEAVDKELERLRDSTMISIFVELLDGDKISENSESSPQDENLIQELEGDKGMVEGIASFVDAVNDFEKVRDGLRETLAQSIEDQRTSHKPCSLLKKLYRGLNYRDIAAARGYFDNFMRSPPISNDLSLSHENENIPAEPNHSHLQEQMSDFFEVADREVLQAGASLSDHFTQFVKDKPDYISSSLLKWLREELEKGVAMQVREPIV